MHLWSGQFYLFLLNSNSEICIILRLSLHPWKSVKQPRRFYHQHKFPLIRITGILFVYLWWQKLSASIALCMIQKNWISSKPLNNQNSTAQELLATWDFTKLNRIHERLLREYISNSGRDHRKKIMPLQHVLVLLLKTSVVPAVDGLWWTAGSQKL